MTASLTVVNAVAGLFAYGFLGNAAVVSTTTQTYGMSLAAFLVSGVAFGLIVNNGLAMFYQHGNQSQIEEVLVTPVNFRGFLVLSSFFEILTALAGSILLFGLSIVLFRITYSYDIPLLLSVIALGILSSIGLGFIGLGFRFVYKQTYVISWVFYSLSGIIGNMLVPVQILPGVLQVASYAMPQYYFFTGIRVALGANVGSSVQLLAIFAIYTMILLITGLVALEYGLRAVRRDGTLKWT
jgi:ABC-type multidrug transport system permease subunit